MKTYLDDLIAYKSLYLLMQKKTSKNFAGELEELKNAAEERCKKYGEYPLVQHKEKVEETSLAPITEEIVIIKKIKNMLGRIRMLLNKDKESKETEAEHQETQQEAMAQLLLEQYEKIIFAPAQIKEVLGRETVMKVLGMDIEKFIKEGKDKTKETKVRQINTPAMEH